MSWLKSLTVTQSLVALFVSGFAVALVFAGIVLSKDLQDYRDLRHDGTVLDLAKGLGAVIHEMQIERGLTSAWIAGETGFADRITQQRASTDAALDALVVDGPSIGSDLIDDVAVRSWLHGHRASVDSGRLDYATHLTAMTDRIRGMIGIIADAALEARSLTLSRQLREDVVLFLAKDNLGLERALGATILATISEDKPVDTAMLDRLTLLTGGRVLSLEAHRALSSRNGRMALGLVERMAPMSLLSQWRGEIIQHVQNKQPAAAPTTPLPTPERWFDTATTLVNSLREIEADGAAELRAKLSEEAATVRMGAQRKAGIFLLLTFGFGACALVTLRSVRSSIRGLIGAIGKLSTNAKGTEIDDCPQADLDCIAEALRNLRDIQIRQQVNHDTAESLRLRFDDHVHDTLRSVDHGNLNRRIELLDLDGPSAVLARGINHLLDQLERKSAA